MKFLCFVSSMLVISLAGCSTLKSNTIQLRLDAYERGCVMRGTEQGIDKVQAKQLCHCHIQKAVAASSPQAFMETVQTIAKQKQTGEQPKGDVKKAIAILKTSFKSCKTELGIKN